jgi:hypothetical protein
MIIFDRPIINEAILSHYHMCYDVCFASGICLRKLSGFQFCRRLFQIEIPASVEVIESSAFSCCASLSEVIFPSDSRLKMLSGFSGCLQLRRFEIPASVELIDTSAFDY